MILLDTLETYTEPDDSYKIFPIIYSRCSVQDEIFKDTNFVNEIHDLENYKSISKYNFRYEWKKYDHLFYNHIDSKIKSQKNQILEFFWQEKLFQNIWAGTSLPKLQSITDVFVTLQCFQPGFIGMNPHLDNRRICIQFVVNLIDNSESTEIFSYKNQHQPIIHAPIKKLTGIGFANTAGSIHNIGPVSSKRLTLYFGISLNG